MNKAKIALFIGLTNTTNNLLVNTLKKFQIETIICNGNESRIKNSIFLNLPDIMLVDYDVLTIDLYDIIQYFNLGHNKNKKIIFIGTKFLVEEKIKIMDAGVDLILEKPFNFNYLAMKIIQLFENKEQTMTSEYKSISEYDTQKIYELSKNEIEKMGVKKDTTAWVKLYKIITLIVEQNGNISNIRDRIYKVVSNEYKVSVDAIESTIRRCINYIWKYGNREYLKDYFLIQDNIDLWEKTKPCNKYFLKTVSQNIINHKITVKKFLEVAPHIDKK